MALARAPHRPPAAAALGARRPRLLPLRPAICRPGSARPSQQPAGGPSLRFSSTAPAPSRAAPLGDSLRPAAGHKPWSREEDGEREAEEWGLDVVNSITNGAAKKEAERLNLRFPLGIGLAVKLTPILRMGIDLKRQYGGAIILMPVGGRWEAYGLDAVALMDCCGLKPEDGAKVPMVRFSNSSLRAVLQRVVDNCLIAAVMETVESSNLRPKPRIMAEHGIVSNKDSQYLLDLGVQQDNKDGSGPDVSPPILGLAVSVNAQTRSFKLVEVHVGQRKVIVHDCMTRDGVEALLAEGMTAPLYFYEAPGSIGQSRAPELAWLAHAIRGTCSAALVLVKKYSGRDPETALTQAIKRSLGLPPDLEFDYCKPDPRPRPAPLRVCTASQLGVNTAPHSSNQPEALLDFVLADQAPELQRRLMGDLLRRAPPPEVAAHIRAACRTFAELKLSLPEWEVLDAGKEVQSIYQMQAVAGGFRKLAKALRQAGELLERPELRPLAEQLLPIAAFKLNRQTEPRALAGNCRDAISTIHSVIQPEAKPQDASRQASEDLPEGELEGELRKFLEGKGRAAFRGQVLDALMAEEREQVSQAARRVRAALQAACELLGARCSGAEVAVEHSAALDGVCIRLTPAAMESPAFAALVEGGEVCVLGGGRGKRCEDLVSTPGLDEALGEYREACLRARAAVRQHEQQLAKRLELQGSHWAVESAVMCCLVASALQSHSTRAQELGWVLPEAAVAGEPLSLTGMRAWWLNNGARNDLEDFDGTIVLSGPNMGGKSTVLRAVAAVAQLAACGLCAPVTAARVPPLDAVWLCMPTTDVPREGCSTFYKELEDISMLLANATANSLVLVDEPCKGTSEASGAAVVGAFVEQQAAERVRCIVATHNRTLLTSETLRFEGVTFLQMAAQADGASRALRAGVQERAFRILPGKFLGSSAMQLLEQRCQDRGFIERARELDREFGAAPGAGDVIPAAAESTKTMAAAMALMQNAAARVGLFRLDASDEPPRATLVPAGDTPPPAAAQGSHAYVLQRADGRWYVGETDRLKERLEQHRSKPAWGKDIKLAAIAVPRERGGKTTAKALERDILVAMRREGYDLLNEMA